MGTIVPDTVQENSSCICASMDHGLKSSAVHEELRALLRREREKRGWSQTKLALEAGLGRKAISFIEDGERNPKLDTLIRISQALGLKLSDMIRACGC